MKIETDKICKLQNRLFSLVLCTLTIFSMGDLGVCSRDAELCLQNCSFNWHNCPFLTGHCSGLLCVADRENGRIQCTDFQGNFQHSIQSPLFHRLFAVEYSPADKVLYAVNGKSGPLRTSSSSSSLLFLLLLLVLLLLLYVVLFFSFTSSSSLDATTDLDIRLCFSVRRSRVAFRWQKDTVSEKGYSAISWWSLRRLPLIGVSVEQPR